MKAFWAKGRSQVDRAVGMVRDGSGRFRRMPLLLKPSSITDTDSMFPCNVGFEDCDAELFTSSAMLRKSQGTSGIWCSHSCT